MSYKLMRPRSLSGLGDQTVDDISTALTVTAGLFRDPDATLRRYAPPILAAAERQLVDPLVSQVADAVRPYVLIYILPVVAGLYVLGGISAYYSYKDYKRVRANTRRRRR